MQIKRYLARIANEYYYIQTGRLEYNTIRYVRYALPSRQQIKGLRFAITVSNPSKKNSVYNNISTLKIFGPLLLLLVDELFFINRTKTTHPKMGLMAI